MSLSPKNRTCAVLVSSGYTDNEKRWPHIVDRQWPFIAKPYSITELLQKLSEIFADETTANFQ